LQKIRWNKDFFNVGNRLSAQFRKRICTVTNAKRNAQHAQRTHAGVMKNFAQMVTPERRKASDSIKNERISAK